MDLIKKIINKKFRIDKVLNVGIIHCKTEQELIKLFKVLTKYGYKWVSGEELLKELKWNRYTTETCIRTKNGKVYFADYAYYKKYQPQSRIYSFEELVFEISDKELLKMK